MVTKSQPALSRPLLHHPILLLLHLCPPLMTKPETRASSLDINSLSDQSSILASHSINEITASVEANASFALSSTSRSNASDSSMVGTQSSKRPWLASQQSDAVVVVDLSNESSMIWKPHEQLLSSNVSIMDVPSDGNCLFYACISKLQNCSTFTIEQASNMRKYVMDYLLLHASNPSGDSMILTWHTLAMMHASEIQSELRHNGFFEMLSFLLLITVLIT